ncbi:hypothetical protein GF420_07835 [candidate division GN15 bacterium]|nr:hypothetical protein [candidate division GN15 bacterium]
MSVRNHNLDAVAPMLATFKVAQSAGDDLLTDASVGEAVMLTDSDEVGPIGDGDQLLGKLIALTLADGDDGHRVATVQIGGICRLKTAATYPVVGNRVVGAGNGAIRQAPELTGDDPAGGAIARGTVLSVNGTTDCVILLN